MKSPLTGKPNVKALYEQHNVPLFQNKVFNTFNEARTSPTENVILSQCQDTGFVFNSNFDMSLLNYDGNYQNEQSNSTYFQNHLDSIILLLEKHKVLKGKVLEVGCGKGFFMNMLLDRGVVISGIDPTYEGESDKVIKDYYSEKYSYLEADLIVLRHTLEHIPKPLEFLQMIAKSNNFRGKIYIEIPTFEWIVKNNAIEDVFYEHCNYFTYQTAKLLFENSEINYSFDGQYLSIIADLKDIKNAIENQNSIEKFNLKFIEEYKSYQTLLSNKTNIAIWGAGAKGSMFLNLLDKKAEKVKCIIDINDKKQGKYLGGTGHKIVNPENIKEYNIENIIIMNKNYFEEISQNINTKNINVYTI